MSPFTKYLYLNSHSPYGFIINRCLGTSLALCQVGDAKDLPKVHKAYARKRKSDHVQHILQDEMDICATAFECEARFVTTVALKKSFWNL